MPSKRKSAATSDATKPKPFLCAQKFVARDGYGLLPGLLEISPIAIISFTAPASLTAASRAQMIAIGDDDLVLSHLRAIASGNPQ